MGSTSRCGEVACKYYKIIVINQVIGSFQIVIYSPYVCVIVAGRDAKTCEVIQSFLAHVFCDM